MGQFFEELNDGLVYDRICSFLDFFTVRTILPYVADQKRIEEKYSAEYYILQRLEKMGFNVEEFTKTLSDNNLIISGSFPLQCLFGEYWDSDIDIYGFFMPYHNKDNDQSPYYDWLTDEFPKTIIKKIRTSNGETIYSEDGSIFISYEITIGPYSNIRNIEFVINSTMFGNKVDLISLGRDDNHSERNHSERNHQISECCRDMIFSNMKDKYPSSIIKNMNVRDTIKEMFDFDFCKITFDGIRVILPMKTKILKKRELVTTTNSMVLQYAKIIKNRSKYVRNYILDGAPLSNVTKILVRGNFYKRKEKYQKRGFNIIFKDE
jgi:hypothetical protein